MAIGVTSSLVSLLLYTESSENIMENSGFPRPLSLLFHTWSDHPLRLHFWSIYEAVLQSGAGILGKVFREEHRFKITAFPELGWILWY